MNFFTILFSEQKFLKNHDNRKIIKKKNHWPSSPVSFASVPIHLMSTHCQVVQVVITALAVHTLEIKLNQAEAQAVTEPGRWRPRSVSPTTWRAETLTKARMVQTGLGGRMSRQTGHPGFGIEGRVRYANRFYTQRPGLEPCDLGKKGGMDRRLRSKCTGQIQQWGKGATVTVESWAAGMQARSPYFAQYIGLFNRSSLYGSS